eukprot:TRINITY_DN7844_c0_g1_i1.p2 TRINITY_DN7844_c0_g1~~TRINITY_DN7844_c0_g1_i1.p2  ORF type:complete len:358 (+),score=85.44 TRINITY_DN7844_c0_g1_i1:2150-3223(+)
MCEARTWDFAGMLDLQDMAHIEESALHKLKTELARATNDLKCMGEEEETCLEENRALKEEMRKLVEQNEKLRKSKEISAAKIKSLERLTGPVKDEVTYIRGERPSMMRTVDSMSLKYNTDSNVLRRSCPVMTVSHVRNRELDIDFDRLEREVRGMLESYTAQVDKAVQSVRDTVESYRQTTSPLAASLSTLQTACQDSRELLLESVRKNAETRLKCYIEDIEGGETFRSMQKQVTVLEKCLAEERDTRAKEMAKMMQRASGSHAELAASLQKEANQKLEKKKEVLREAEEQRKRDDAAIQSLTERLGSLTRQCSRLSTARHYEMVGLASEIGIVKNDMKMLEHHLKRKGPLVPVPVP